MKGMGEGVQLMVEGERRRLWIPEALAFAGARGRPKGDLMLEVDLLAWDRHPETAPADVAAAPADALTAKGLRYRILRQGPPGPHPNRRSRVTVHYSGWTTDGKLFDSSLLRGVPQTLAMDEVIRGWTDGVQLLEKGTQARFWIPEKLAYRGEPGKPAGMLVFDIELLDFYQ
jgi:peptidylprolyl isomerase